MDALRWEQHERNIRKQTLIESVITCKLHLS